jgi:hypothetical protein
MSLPALHKDIQTRPLWTALILTVAAIAVYWPALSMAPVSDDFYFIGQVAPASSMFVAYEPLLGMFLRPAVVAMYYVAFHAGGLSPWLYHLLTLLPHLVASIFLYLSLERLAGSAEWWWAFLAALLFVVFGGHSEAVAFPAGFADPAVAAGLMAAFYCYLRALDASAPSRWLAGFVAGMLFAAHAKEAWVMFPGILIAHVVTMGVPPAARRRAMVAIGLATAMVAAYLALRIALFGGVTAGMTVVGSTLQSGEFLEQQRAFLLRCFAPAGRLTATLWLSGRDVLIWPAALAILGVFARGARLRIIVFSALAMAAALVPTASFTISVSSTESERYIYLATLFSCPLLVWSIVAVLRNRIAATALCLVIIAVHSVALVRINTVWHEAGALAQGIIESYATQVQTHDPGGRTDVVVLNLPDHVLEGPFVFRVGFYPAIAVGSPETVARTGATLVVSSVNLRTTKDATVVVRTGARRFLVDFGPNQIVQTGVASGPNFRILRQTRTDYEIEFADTIDEAIVLYLSGGRLEFAGRVKGSGAPIGVLDLPSGDSVCEGVSLRFAGWALDRGGLPRVTLEDADGLALGVAVPRPGMRPDVAAAYYAFPTVEAAGWDFELPCDAVRRAGGALQVRVTARDNEGTERLLGERKVTVR